MEHIETERKYLIKMPSIEMLERAEGYFKRDIEQIYLESDSGVTSRIRRSVKDGVATFSRTDKIRISNMSAIEREWEITESEYEDFRKIIKNGSRPIHKTRHTFVFKTQTFEVDVYPEWNKYAVLETELKSENSKVEFPPYIEIFCEVTGDKRYSNAGMSKAFPKEPQ